MPKKNENMKLDKGLEKMQEFKLVVIDFEVLFGIC